MYTHKAAGEMGGKKVVSRRGGGEGGGHGETGKMFVWTGRHIFCALACISRHCAWQLLTFIQSVFVLEEEIEMWMLNCFNICL